MFMYVIIPGVSIDNVINETKYSSVVIWLDSQDLKFNYIKNDLLRFFNFLMILNYDVIKNLK
jgi:hypothetical protein